MGWNKVTDVLIGTGKAEDPEAAVERNCVVDEGEGCSCSRCQRLAPWLIFTSPSGQCELIAAAVKALRFAAFFKSRERSFLKPQQHGHHGNPDPESTSGAFHPLAQPRARLTNVDPKK